MGVRGIRHLLKDVGWIETKEASGSTSSDNTSTQQPCNGKIWKEWNSSNAFFLGSNSNNTSNALPLEKIPPNARFWIDGNGLAFYLHTIAYTRYLSSLPVAGRYSNNTNIANAVYDCPTTKEVMADPVATTLALPCMLPLSILRSVTKEFVAGLRDKVDEMTVLWDGPFRRFKATTDQQRQQDRDREESYLELYCNHATLMAQKRNLEYACEWKDIFPFTKLFGTCVKHALSECCATLQNVQCQEEADVELARNASGDSLSYVVGFDSDFFFYKDIQYIPLNQLVVQHPSGLHAFVARRSKLSGLLGFGEENDHRLIDLVLLMGNDYVDPFVCLEVPKEIDLTSVQSMVYYLQCHEDYFVQVKNNNNNKTKNNHEGQVNFCRSLYNLHSLEAFPFDNKMDPSFRQHHQHQDREMVLQPCDTMVRNGLLRHLQAALDSANPDSKFPLTEQAIRAFEVSSTPDGRQSQSMLALTTRPTYDETKAAKFIELCIARCYRESKDSLLIRSTPPDYLMSRIHFHAALASFREPDLEKEIAPDEIREEEEEPTPVETFRLPIDDHQDAILENIRNQRVTIIHGETGCGKSSRVPVMLLNSPPPDSSLQTVRFFISQPRRIAAKALVERVRSCEPELRDKFALRMGHGWREYETKDTQVYFVTTGYLVRLLANHPERFDSCTHLVIDEVHERSVDTDILCLLCRRLLETNKTIRLVLMSATLATKMYKAYFNVPNEPIHVGVRTYPITEYFVEDLERFGLPQQEVRAAKAIQREVDTNFCSNAPSAMEMKHRFSLAARLASIVCEPGSSVLIFVPGMAEIIAISEAIEAYHKAGIRYTCFPIHGDIPFEEQMDAFNPPEFDEVKVIIATNAAESSVTLPNVDHVICLGLCRQIVYNQASHRQMLTSAWISKASATQRAGRTGRVRPGNVYRLYTKKAFDSHMEEFEPGEMLRIPLDSVILMLKQILHEEVIPVFMNCLEPPALDTIENSFRSLKYWNFITEANDMADITPLGSFVSALGIDLALGSFVGLGIQFGVAAEAIEMAAMMSLPKTPFQITSPMWLSPGKFNKLASQTYASKSRFDGGLYSEPMGLMNALWDSESINASKKFAWTMKNNIAMKRWQQVVSSRNSLRKRVAGFLGINEDKLQVQVPPRNMPREKIAILRILKVWVFSDSIIECAPSKLQLSRDGSVVLSVKPKSGINLEATHLDKILQSERHPFSIVERNKTEQSGVFVEEGHFSFRDFIDGFERRLLSYASEKDIGAALCYSNEELYLYLDKTNDAFNTLGQNLLEIWEAVSSLQELYVYDFCNKKRRGIQERTSGMWTVTKMPNTVDPFARQKRFLRIDLNVHDAAYDFGSKCAAIIREVLGCDYKSKMIWHFFTQKESKKKKKKMSSSQPFLVQTIGECKKVSSTDLEDLLGRKPLSVATNCKNSVQTIVVQQPPKPQQPDTSGYQEPLFPDVPEGARVLAMLASSQRKGKKYVLKIPKPSENEESEETFDFAMNEGEINVSMRWKRLNSSNPVYVDSSVPATALHTSNDLYAVASSGLELRSGGMRVEGLTLLPPNPLFLLLSHLSFGIEMSSPLSWALSLNNDDGKTKKKIKKSYDWLVNRASKVSKGNSSKSDEIILSSKPLTDNTFSEAQIWHEEELKTRFEQAILFNENASSMEEKLVCFPEKIRELCDLFSGVNGGQNLSPWNSIEEECLTAENLKKWQWDRKSSTNEGQRRKVPSAASRQPAAPAVAKTSKSTQNIGTQKKQSKIEVMDRHPIRHFDTQLISASKKWFAIALPEGEEMPAFPSSNILALIFQQYEGLISSDDEAENTKLNFDVALDTANWDIVCYKGKNGKNLYYKALFVNHSIASIPVFGRGKNKVPKWIKQNRCQPSTVADARDCIPPTVECPAIVESKSDGLLFESIEDAVRMESCFWLNKQFCHARKSSTRHWYAHSMDQIIGLLEKHKKNNTSTNTS